jgi:hypothetical protein
MLTSMDAIVRRGYSEDKESVLKRLRRIEGQVRGLQRMVDDDRYCIDILEQISAATRALQSVGLAAARGPHGALRGRGGQERRRRGDREAQRGVGRDRTSGPFVSQGALNSAGRELVR